MPELRHEITLEAVPRHWFEQIPRELFDVVAGWRFQGGRLVAGPDALEEVRLVKGRHLKRGARYRLGPADTPVDVAVEAWDRTGRTRLRFAADLGGEKITATVELIGGARGLKAAGVSGRHGRGLRRFSWKATADLERWWTPGGDGRDAPIAVSVRHPLARGALRIGRRSAERGRWEVGAAVGAHGRWLLRPLAGAVLLAGRPWLRRPFVDAVEQAAERWNETVTELLREEPGEELVLTHRTVMAPVPPERLAEWLRFEGGGLPELLKDRCTGWTLSVTANGVDGPLAVRLSHDDRSPGELKSLDVRADLARWWERAAGGGGPEAPVTAVLRWPLAEADVRIDVAPAGAGRWAVDVAVTVRGREWGTPLVALASRLAAPHLRRELASYVNVLAGRAGEAAEMGPQEGIEHLLGVFSRVPRTVTLGELRAMSDDELRLLPGGSALTLSLEDYQALPEEDRRRIRRAALTMDWSGSGAP